GPPTVARALVFDAAAAGPAPFSGGRAFSEDRVLLLGAGELRRDVVLVFRVAMGSDIPRSDRRELLRGKARNRVDTGARLVPTHPRDLTHWTGHRFQHQARIPA